MAHFYPSDGGERHHRLREGLSVLAAISGGLGLLGLIIAAIGSVGPGRATWLWIGSSLLIVAWLVGSIWRADAPDARNRQRERERRGF